MTYLYSIGEKVSLQSQSMSEYNGTQYTIEAIIEASEDFVCRLTGQTIYTNEGHAYILDTPLVDLIDCDGMETLWAEESLRKIQEIGDKSFQEFVEKLKTENYDMA